MCLRFRHSLIWSWCSIFLEHECSVFETSNGNVDTVLDRGYALTFAVGDQMGGEGIQLSFPPRLPCWINKAFLFSDDVVLLFHQSGLVLMIL